MIIDLMDVHILSNPLPRPHFIRTLEHNPHFFDEENSLLDEKRSTVKSVSFAWILSSRRLRKRENKSPRNVYGNVSCGYFVINISPKPLCACCFTEKRLIRLSFIVAIKHVIFEFHFFLHRRDREMKTR